ncbi:hypothetical protein J437_LFUL008918 [Ladona fulva]|uniref:lysozyme n=1 Tax=Ladona fulva TaxID=123851 RepID=A0A8K0KAI5_LADFU|nr:hypothetical protein J437_LFUL008918 [Ladona fulva]
MSFRLIVFLAVIVCSAHVLGVFISNLSDSCLHCLCMAATSCNSTGCKEGYCGPFYISNVYWSDADKPVLPEDDPVRSGAYQDCANNYNCAKRIVERYMAKFGRDCNGDLITNCDDYALIHFNGGYGCETSIEGTGYHSRYKACSQTDCRL